MRSLLVSSSRNHPLIPALRERMALVRGFEAPEFSLPDQCLAACRKSPPNVVIVVMVPAEAEQSLELVRQLRAEGQWHLLAVGPIADSKLLLKTMQAGAEVYLDQDDLKAELHSALYRVHVRQTNPDHPGQLVAVLSTSGGCGASTIAVNLAITIAKVRHVCNLIDLNIGKADLAPLLDLKPQYTMADVCRHEGRLDASLFAKLLAPHSSGIRLLAAPNDPSEVAEMSTESIARAIDLAAESFTDVVVDLEDCFHDEQIAVLRKATRVFLVCRLDFTSIRHTRRILDHLAKQNIAADRVEVVVNQFEDCDQLPVAEAERAIRMKIAHFIPQDAATMGLANNLGVPAALTHADSKVVQSIARLIGLHNPVPPPPTWTQWLHRKWQPLRTQLRDRVKRFAARRAPSPLPSTTPEVTRHHEPAFHTHSGDSVRTFPA